MHTSLKGLLALTGGAITALGTPAGPAVAEPISSTGADVVVQHLKDEGYTVQFNMPSEMALSRCTVSGINGLTVMMSSDGNLMAMMAPAGSRGTVYVTLACPDSNN